MGNYENAPIFEESDGFWEGFAEENALDELLTEEETAFLDNLIANKEVLDEMLVHLPIDMETEAAAAEDNAIIDALIDEIEEKAGRKLSDIERIELENDILSSLIEGIGEECDDDKSDNA